MGMVIDVRVVIVKMQLAQKEKSTLIQILQSNFDFFYDSYAHPDHSNWKGK